MPSARAATQSSSCPLVHGGAHAAADPGKHHAPIAHLGTGRVGADGDHGAGDLVAEHARRRDAAAQVHPVAVAEIEIAFMQVDVAVAQAAAADAHEHLGAGRLRRFAEHLRQGLAEGVEREAEHGGHLKSVGTSPL